MRDDTEADALAAQVRRYRPLPVDEVGRLLEAVRSDRGGAAAQRLVEHHLAVALEAAIARRTQLLTVEDLFQEGAIAMVSGVGAYARDARPASGLRDFLRTMVAGEVDRAVREAEAQRREDEAAARDAELLQATELRLRRTLGHEATLPEVAAALEWPPGRVELVRHMISLARSREDEEITPYLDDEVD